MHDRVSCFIGDLQGPPGVQEMLASDLMEWVVLKWPRGRYIYTVRYGKGTLSRES